MDEILRDLGKPAWWFTTILIAILINLLSDWLGSRIGNVFADFTWYEALEREQREAERQRRIDALVERMWAGDDAAIDEVLKSSFIATYKVPATQVLIGFALLGSSWILLSAWRGNILAIVSALVLELTAAVLFVRAFRGAKNIARRLGELVAAFKMFEEDHAGSANAAK